MRMILLWLVLPSLLCSSVHGVFADPVAFILDIRGNWFMNGSQVFKGSSLTAGGVLTFSGDNQSAAYVNIADQAGKLITSERCPNTGSCIVKVPDALPASDSVLKRVFRGIMDLWSGKPEKYGVFKSQGNNEELQEAVVKLDDGKVDLTLVLRGLRKGRYLLDFKPLSVPNAPTSRSQPLTVDWDPQKPASLSIPNLQTGLYEIHPLEENTGEPIGPGTEAWVLIANPTEYEKLRSCFNRAQTVTKQWGASVNSNTVRSFLRGDLDYLASNSTACD